MISNKPIVIGKKGSMILEADLAWSEYCAKAKIINPIKQSLDLRLDRHIERKNQDGSWTISFKESTEEQKKLEQDWKAQIPQFEKIQDSWELDWLWENCGWEYAEYFANLRNNDNNKLWELFTDFWPCVNPTDEFKECNMFCKNFENCARRGFKNWN